MSDPRVYLNQKGNWAVNGVGTYAVIGDTKAAARCCATLLQNEDVFAEFFGGGDVSKELLSKIAELLEVRPVL